MKICRSAAPAGTSGNPRQALVPLKRRPLALIAVLACLQLLRAEEKPEPVEAVLLRAREAVVLIESADREGEQKSIGTGFIVRPEGIIATNYHVIGEGRRFAARLAGGRRLQPLEIMAVDRLRDLAVVRVDAGGLPVLPLGDSDAVEAGQEVIALGNPLGLEWSASRGIIAARRDFEGRELLQVAMAIEPGSSGSPLMDLEGRVLGLLAIKSGGALGFAVPAKDLKRLLDDPHPVPMERWLTIGALDAAEWRPSMGGNWRQRAGRIVAEGEGSGFGGRTLCLSERPVPEGRFDLEVEVRLEDESGAAGLAFHADGGDRHYGFYPTAGSLRLTRFDGPDVFTWTILRTVQSFAYRPGEWNRIRVRVDGKKITCSVNGEVAVELEDDGLAAGRAGIVKFRAPGAEFRRFRIAPELPSSGLDAASAAKLEELTRERAGSAVDLAAIEALGPLAADALLERARSLEKHAEALRGLSARLHLRLVERELRETLDRPDAEVDLFRAALLVSRLDNRDLESADYLERLGRMAAAVRAKLPENASDADKLDALRRHLFEDLAFHPSRLDYYHRSNSYLNEVLDDREGIPITLAVLFLELARRLQVPAVGVGVPRHFLVGYRLGESDERLIDVFNGGRTVSRAEAAALCGQELSPSDFAPASKRAIIARMFRNLYAVAEHERDTESMMRYLDAILAIDEDAAAERLRRSQLRLQAGDAAGAAADVDWLIEREPEGLDIDGLRQLREAMRRRMEG
jgi:regulator of sirC expression with transglutaminase-like and TPR domain/S1-C subfamily serine protease